MRAGLLKGTPAACNAWRHMAQRMWTLCSDSKLPNCHLFRELTSDYCDLLLIRLGVQSGTVHNSDCQTHLRALERILSTTSGAFDQFNIWWHANGAVSGPVCKRQDSTVTSKYQVPQNTINIPTTDMTQTT